MDSREADLRWLGGYLSCGGCFSFIERQDCCFVSLRLQSTSELILREVQRIVDAEGCFTGPREPNKKALGVPQGRRQVFALLYSGHKLANFLQVLMPYLRGHQKNKLQDILERSTHHGTADRPPRRRRREGRP